MYSAVRTYICIAVSQQWDRNRQGLKVCLERLESGAKVETAVTQDKRTYDLIQL